MTRPRLQLHLSTLLIVSFLAAGMVWLNVGDRVTSHRIPILEGVHAIEDMYFCGRGWPCAYELWYDDTSNHLKRWRLDALRLDASVLLFLLAVAAVAIEWATRRMKRTPL
jgi:hypothetical protein